LHDNEKKMLRVRAKANRWQKAGDEKKISAKPTGARKRDNRRNYQNERWQGEEGLLREKGNHKIRKGPDSF